MTNLLFFSFFLLGAVRRFSLFLYLPPPCPNRLSRLHLPSFPGHDGTEEFAPYCVSHIDPPDGPGTGDGICQVQWIHHFPSPFSLPLISSPPSLPFFPAA